MAVVPFILAIGLGGFAGLFLVQVLVSLLNLVMFLAAIVVSKVPKAVTATGALVSAGNIIVYGTLMYAGEWEAAQYIQFTTPNPFSIAASGAFLLVFGLVLFQVPGRLMLAYMTGYEPGFADMCKAIPKPERGAFAMKQRADIVRKKAV